MFNPDKIIEDMYKDDVYIDGCSYHANIYENYVDILISTDSPSFQFRPPSYPKVSDSDNIYLRKNGESVKKQRTVESIEIRNNNNMYTSMGITLTDPSFKTIKSMNTFNINSVSGDQVQIGESNNMVTNISVLEFVEKIANSNDPQAKSILRKLLENSTVAGIVGAGASALFGLL